MLRYQDQIGVFKNGGRDVGYDEQEFIGYVKYKSLLEDHKGEDRQEEMD